MALPRGTYPGTHYQPQLSPNCFPRQTQVSPLCTPKPPSPQPSANLEHDCLDIFPICTLSHITSVLLTHCVLQESSNITLPIQFFLIPQLGLGDSSMFLQVPFPLTNHLHLGFFHTGITT